MLAYVLPVDERSQQASLRHQSDSASLGSAL